MSKSQFTKGPWKAVVGQWAEGDPIFGFAVRCADDKEHQRRNELSIVSIGLAEPSVSAGSSYSQEELVANARLIAAAPALYEALKATPCRTSRVKDCGECDRCVALASVDGVTK